MDAPEANQRRNTALFVAVSLVSGFGGTAMSLVAGVWVMALTGSASLAGLVGLCVFLPTLFGPVFGTVIDRLPRQRLLVWTNLAVAASLTTLLAVRSADQTWIIFVIMLIYGVGYVLVDAGEAALLPAALPAAALGTVNGLRMSAQEGTKLVAPLAAAGLFIVIGGAAVAALAAVMLMVAAAVYRLVKAGDEPSPTARGQLIRNTLGGVGFLWRQRELRAAVLVASAAMTASGLAGAPMFALIEQGLGRPAAFMGVLASAQGAGTIAAGLLVGRFMTWRTELTAGVLGTVLFAMGTAGRLIPSVPVVVVSSVVVGIGLSWSVVAAMTAVQRQTPGDLLGRVAATANTLVFGVVALSTPLGAGLLLILDYRWAFVVAALFAATAAVWHGRRSDQRRPGDQRKRWRAMISRWTSEAPS